MSNLPETPSWESGIHQLEEADRAKAGPGGILNIPSSQLANRTRWLKVQVESAADYREYTFFKSESDPDGTLTGIANTPDGKMFRVAQGTESEDSFIYYLNANGVAYPVAAYVGKGYVDNRLVPGPYRSSYIPLFHDFNGMVPMWLDEGRPDAAGFGPNLRGEVAAIPNQWAQQYLAQMSYTTRYFPLFHDRNGNVPIWLKNGLLDGAGFGPGLLGVITALIESAPGGAGYADKYFIPGDQYKFIFKRGLIFSGENTSLNVGFTGDSWTEANTIPQSMINVLGGTSKDPGWISCSTRASSVMSGITLSRSGFTQYDGDNENGNASPLYGSGPDGIALYNTGTASWIMWTGVKATDLTLFYYDGTGSFDIVIDGTTTATITGGNTGKALTHVISGLTSSTHTVRVQAPGDGVVSILGMYGKDSGNPRGVTVSRMGNSGAMASDYLFWKDWIAPVASYLDIDMLFIILGTNDFRKSAGTAEYENGIQTIIDKYKAATPGICICLISPAQGNATGTPALEEYDSSMRKLAVNNGVSFISGYQIFPKSYSNANGAWQDNLHLSSKGALVLTSTIKNHFFQE